MAETTPTSTTATTVPADPVVGQETGSESSLSTWAGDYVTDMMGRGAALADEPYYAYEGPLTAGASDAQQAAFSGVAGLTLPTENVGAFTPQSFTDEGVAGQYMNPYLMESLNPQLREAQRAADMQRLQDASRLTKAGAYGGSRQAIMEAEGTRNLSQLLSDITGKGYAQAYDTAADQFNREQIMGKDANAAANQYLFDVLKAQRDLGAVERSIEAEGIAADKAQFEEERDDPYKKVQYMQSLLQGMPIESVSTSYAEASDLSNLLGSAGGIMQLLSLLGFGGGSSGSSGDSSSSEPEYELPASGDVFDEYT